MVGNLGLIIWARNFSPIVRDCVPVFQHPIIYTFAVQIDIRQ